MKIIFNSFCDEECFNVLRTVLFDYLRFLKSEDCELVDRDEFINGVRYLLARLDRSYDSLLNPSSDVVELDFTIREARYIYFAAHNQSNLDLRSRCFDELCQIILPYALE